MKHVTFVTAIGALVLVAAGCTTKGEIRRQQELDRIKQDVTAVKTEKADVDQQVEEVRTETQRLAALVDEQANFTRGNVEEIKREIAALAARIQALEQRAVEEEVAARKAADRTVVAPGADTEKEKPAPAATLDAGKKLYEAGKYDDAAEVFRAVVKRGRGDEARRAQYQLAEALFAAKDYKSAALEYGEFKKSHPKDALVPSAIFRQGQAFQHLGKKKEAKLFYEELLESHPKSQWASKARSEMKRLR